MRNSSLLLTQIVSFSSQSARSHLVIHLIILTTHLSTFLLHVLHNHSQIIMCHCRLLSLLLIQIIQVNFFFKMNSLYLKPHTCDKSLTRQIWLFVRIFWQGEAWYGVEVRNHCVGWRFWFSFIALLCSPLHWPMPLHLPFMTNCKKFWWWEASSDCHFLRAVLGRADCTKISACIQNIYNVLDEFSDF